MVQQYRSTLRAQPRRRMVRDGEEGGDGEASMAIGGSGGQACGVAGERMMLMFLESQGYVTSHPYGRLGVETGAGMAKARRTRYPHDSNIQLTGAHTISPAYHRPRWEQYAPPGSNTQWKQPIVFHGATAVCNV